MDNFRLTYPLYALRIRQGFHALESKDAQGEARLAVAVFSSTELAEAYMTEMELQGKLATFTDAADFWHFLQGMKAPAADVVFDLHVAPEGHLEGDTRTRDELLTKHLPVVHAWSYPLYVLRQGEGYAEVSGSAVGRGTVHLAALFTDRERAGLFQQETGETATLEPLANAAAFAAFLQHSKLEGVILNPDSPSQGFAEQLCIDKETLLRKYLRVAANAS